MSDTMIQWLTISPKLLEGVEVSNTIDNIKFSLLLSRLFKFNQKQIEAPFTEEELKKLELSLKLDAEKLKLVIQMLNYVIKRSTYFILKPTFLLDELVERLKFESSKGEIFVKLWTESTKTDFDLQQRKQLEKISWELNLQIASDASLKMAIPVSLLQFHVKDNEGKNENITVEMDEKQLLELYNDIEHMQSVLDSLNK